MTSCYLKTVEYTKGRDQFDKQISNFQVLQHRMVDMFIESELAKSLLFKAMLEVDADSDEKYKHVSALKAHVGKSGKISADIFELWYLPIIISRFLDASERSFFLFKSSAFLDSASDLAKRRSLLWTIPFWYLLSTLLSVLSLV